MKAAAQTIVIARALHAPEAIQNPPRGGKAAGNFLGPARGFLSSGAGF